MSVWSTAVRARAWFDRPLRERWQQLARDVSMLGRGLRGERVGHPELIARGPGRAADPSRGPQTGLARGRAMRVAEVVRETADAVTLVLAGDEPLTWRAGEFLTLGVSIDGRVERRAYSICRAPAPGALPAVTVKRVAGGLVSSWLVAHAAPGLALDVVGPSGRFVHHPPPPGPDALASGGENDNSVVVRGDDNPVVIRQHVLVGGGSGITPLVAILEAALAADASTRVHLVYGNRAEADIIFRARLDALAVAHPERLCLTHALSDPPPAWSGATGMLDAATLARLLPRDLPADATDYWLCGPTPMMDAARAVLAERGVDPGRVRSETFLALGHAQARSAAASASAARALPTTPQPVTFRRGTMTRSTLAAPGRTLLEAGVAAGLAMPHSCTLGGCGACRVRVRGDVVHDEPNCLGTDEAAAGHALACVARPLGPVEVELEVEP